jgi:hypothetical protein
VACFQLGITCLGAFTAVQTWQLGQRALESRGGDRMAFPRLQACRGFLGRRRSSSLLNAHKEATKGGNFRIGNPSYRARLMEKKTSDVSLSFCQGVSAVRRSLSSSRSRSRYQDGGDCRDRPNILCHRLRSALIVGRIFVWD